MADNTKIEWTDATWNPITGCSVVSPGCTNCYAMKLAGTRLKNHPTRTGLTIDSKAGPVWNGQVRFNETMLLDPLRWKRPRMIFVCAHGDLFAENVPDEWIDRVFAVMALAPHHAFQVLTKRPERMRAYFVGRRQNFGRASDVIHHAIEHSLDEDDQQIAADWLDLFDCMGTPQHNVWLGVSVEDQKRADERIPILLETPAAIRWISAEPLLGPVEIVRHLEIGHLDSELGLSNPGIDWVVAGGESGRGARPMHPEWVRSLRDQCAATDTPFLFKQWGEWMPSTPERAAGKPHSGWRCLAAHPHVPKPHELYPESGAAFIERVGKRVAGRLLDGIEHNGFPEARAE